MSKSTERFIKLSKVTRVLPLRRGVELEIDQEKARFEFVKANIMRIKITKNGVFDPKPSFAVVCDEFGTPKFRVKTMLKKVVLISAEMECEIDFEPFAFRFNRHDGSLMFATVPGETYKFLNNQWSTARYSKNTDTYLGFGEKTGGLNQNGRFLQMWNTDVLSPDHSGVVRVEGGPKDPASTDFDPYYISIPFYYYLDENKRAFGSFVDNGGHLAYDLRALDQAEVIGRSGQYTEYVMCGPDLTGILAAYNLLTGMPALPPLWSLGHHQCRWHKYDEKSWKELGATYRAKKIPCDVLWLDIDYMDGYRVFTWDKSLFPNISKTLEDLKKDGFRAITIVDPGVKYEPGYAVFDEGQERQLFCQTESGQTYVGHVWPGLTAFPDFVNEEARRWWGRLNADHVKSGLAGIWNDMNEPASWLPTEDMRFGHNRYSHEKYHNSYAMLQAMGTREGLQTAMPGLRTFILSRGGSAGIQRYAANWCGDNCSCWEHLAMSVYMNCNLSISGQTFVGGDIGGFCRDSNGELLARWYEYGVFQPFCRNHSATGTALQYPWSFGEEYEKIIQKWVGIRYQLLPYIYTATMRYAQTNQPLMRPMVFDYQNDPAVTNNSTEFLFGPDFLIAPVTKESAKNRRFYLPGGTWYEFESGKKHEGGKQVTIAVPLDTIPVLVKAGAVVPLAPVRQSTMEVSDTVTLRIYMPARDGDYTSYLYEDDGLTESCANGEYLETKLTLSVKGKVAKLTGKVSGSGFRTMSRKHLHIEVVGGKYKDVDIDNAGENFTLVLK